MVIHPGTYITPCYPITPVSDMLSLLRAVKENPDKGSKGLEVQIQKANSGAGTLVRVRTT